MSAPAVGHALDRQFQSLIRRLTRHATMLPVCQLLQGLLRHVERCIAVAPLEEEATRGPSNHYQDPKT